MSAGASSSGSSSSGTSSGSGKMLSQGSAWKLLKRFWPYARPYKAWLLLGLAMIPIVAATGAWRPLLVKEAVDEAIPQGNLENLKQLALIFVSLVGVEFVALSTQIFTLQRAGHSTIFDLRMKIFRHVMRMPAAFFDRTPLGSLLSRSSSDVEALGETLSFGVFTILTDVAMIGTILSAMFVLDTRLTLISLSISPFLYLLVRFFSEALRRLQLEIRKATGVQSGYLTEQLTGISVVQLHGREEASHQNFHDFGKRYLKATKLSNIYDALLFSVMEGISAFCVALLLYFAVAETGQLRPGLTLGLLFAFVDYLQRIFVPIRDFSGKLATIQRAAASLERIYSLLDRKEDGEGDSGQPSETLITEFSSKLVDWTGGVRVRDLRFRYRKDGPEILRGVSFDIQPGQVVAVVGRTGSGKTSLGRILSKTYGGYEGQIDLLLQKGDAQLSELDLQEIPPDPLRQRLLMVQQDVYLFDDSVRFNITLGEAELEADEAKLKGVLKTVQLDEVLQDRGGLQAPVGERGQNLSAGEAQLLAFARVAARSPTMLILDEATASVDSMTEQKVQQAIESLLKGRTVLVIAHRLSTIRHADKIW